MTHDNTPTQDPTQPRRRGRHGADQFFIKGMATGKSVIQAAKLAGISERTANRRMQDPEINRQISEARAALMEVAVDNLCRATDPASQTLYALLKAPSDNVKLSAARTILEKSVTVRDHQELDVRMQEIELIHAEGAPSQTVAQCYWPDTLEEGPPAVDGLDISHGYRHKATWMDFMLNTGGVPDDKVAEIKQEIAELRDAADKYDAAIASVGREEAAYAAAEEDYQI